MAGQIGSSSSSASKTGSRSPRKSWSFPIAHGLAKSTASVLQAIDFLDAESKLYDAERFAEMQRDREEKRQRGRHNAVSPSLTGL